MSGVPELNSPSRCQDPARHAHCTQPARRRHGHSRRPWRQRSPRIVHRAAKIATTPPTGPVFISLPGDILNAFGAIDLGQATRVDTRVRPSDESLRALAERLLRAERPVIIAGHEIIRSDALAEAARFAEVLGCPVYDQTVLQGAHFPSHQSASVRISCACRCTARSSRSRRIWRSSRSD